MRKYFRLREKTPTNYGVRPARFFLPNGRCCGTDIYYTEYIWSQVCYIHVLLYRDKIMRSARGIDASPLLSLVSTQFDVSNIWTPLKLEIRALAANWRNPEIQMNGRTDLVDMFGHLGRKYWEHCLTNYTLLNKVNSPGKVSRRGPQDPKWRASLLYFRN